MQQRERKPRWRKRFEALMRLDGERIIGYLSNISNEGMEIRTKSRLQVNDELSIRIVTPDGQRFNYLSEIRWWRPAHGKQMGEGVYRYGLRHMAVDPGHSQLVDLVRYDPIRRGKNRYTIELPVEITSTAEYIKVVTDNISTTGAFLKTADLQPPYRDDLLSVKINLPKSSDSLSIKAKVVHLLQPSWAVKLGLPPGLGLRFTELSDADKNKLQIFLDNNKNKIQLQEDDDTLPPPEGILPKDE